jgi:hypothetical protein
MDCCDYCTQELIEISRLGERLVGCVECNRWTWPYVSEGVSLELPEEDIWAVRAVASSPTLR